MNGFSYTPSLLPERLRFGVAAVFGGALLIGAAGAVAAPAQSELAASIHHNAQAALHQIQAHSLPSHKIIAMPAAPHAEVVSISAQDGGIVAASRQAPAAIARAQRGQINPGSQAPLATTLAQAHPAASPVRIDMLEMLRVLTEDAAFRWIPEVSPWLRPRPGVAWLGHGIF